MKLLHGDVDGAADLVQKALDTKAPDAAHALTSSWHVSRPTRPMGDAAIELPDHRFSKDPRTIAWSHIYLGRDP